MHLGIDASNIRDGGGMTHLVQLLRAAEPSTCGFERVTGFLIRAREDDQHSASDA